MKFSLKLIFLHPVGHSIIRLSFKLEVLDGLIFVIFQASTLCYDALKFFLIDLSLVRFWLEDVDFLVWLREAGLIFHYCLKFRLVYRWYRLMIVKVVVAFDRYGFRCWIYLFRVDMLIFVSLFSEIFKVFMLLFNVLFLLILLFLFKSKVKFFIFSFK